MLKFLAAFSLLALASPADAGKPKSIVGDWAMPGETCENPISIGPMSMKSEDVDCRFTSVRRRGNRVTWDGICDDAEGSSGQTVIATENNGRLTIRYVPGGNVLENLRRCAP